MYIAALKFREILDLDLSEIQTKNKKNLEFEFGSLKLIVLIFFLKSSFHPFVLIVPSSLGSLSDIDSAKPTAPGSPIQRSRAPV